MRHPARYSLPLLDEFTFLLGDDCKTVLDPFAGTGRIHLMAERGNYHTVGVEIEPEWANLHPRTIVGDALALPFRDGSFDAVVTSPTYGNRMADHHEARDGSRRNTYRHALGRPLHDRNSGAMQWGDSYREFHRRTWLEVWRVCSHLFVLNIKNHIRNGVEQLVSEWHDECIQGIGFRHLATIPVPLPGNRFGANGNLRIDHESIYVYERP